MNSKIISIGELYRFTIKIIRDKWEDFTLVSLLLLVNFALPIIPRIFPGTFVLLLLPIFITPFIAYKVLYIVQDKKADLNFKKYFKIVGIVFVVTLLHILITYGGLILLVIPYIYLHILLIFATIAVLDNNI